MSALSEDIEFWRLETVMAKTGYSRSEIYRKVKAGTFPPSHPYNDGTRRRFWLSSEVRTWQRGVLDAVVEGLFA